MILSVGAAVAALLGFEYLGWRSPTGMLLLLAIAVNVWFTDRGKGLLSAGLALASMAYFFVTPRFSLAFALSEVPYYLNFVALAVLIVWAGTVRRRIEAEQKRDEQIRSAQHGVARALAESESLAAAAAPLLSAIGENMHWEWGALWTVESEPAVLRCEVLWHAAGVDTSEFDRVSRAMAFKPGEGQPGRVWKSGKAEWMLDVGVDPAFLRRDAAARAALHSGVAFPILDLHSPGSPGADREGVVEPAFTSEAFYTTKDSGLGMGLSICQSMVEAHGGRLRASANEPRGAVFQFTLPAPDLRPASRDS